MERYWTRIHDLDREGDVDELSLVTHVDLPAYYNRFYDRIETRAWNRAWVRAGMPDRGRCLELGPGRGRWTARLEQRGMRVSGLDISARATELLRRRFPSHEFHQGSVHDIPLDSGSVDVVCSVVVLLHVPPPQRERGIDEIARVLKPGGSVLLIESIHVGDPASHTFPMTREAWRATFARRRLECVHFAGQEYIPLIRFHEWAERRAKPEAGRGSFLFRGWVALASRGPARKLTVAASRPVERLVEALLPARFARHGVFVFRKR